MFVKISGGKFLHCCPLVAGLDQGVITRDRRRWDRVGKGLKSLCWGIYGVNAAILFVNSAGTKLF